MKRKLPQWLLDCTNNNNAKCKRNPRFCSNDENARNSYTHPKADVERPSGNKISVIPIISLLCPSRGGVSNISNNIESEQNKAYDSEVPNNQQNVVKTEIIEEPLISLSNLETETAQQPEVKTVDPLTTEVTINNPTDDQKINVKTEQNVSIRLSCSYGVKCYRRTANHRAQMAHPGDVDYRRPCFPNALPGAPLCPWGAACYRRNPQHFIQLSHPPASIYDPLAPGPTVPLNRTRQVRQHIPTYKEDLDTEDDYDLEDSFINDDNSDDYIPEGDNHDDDYDDDDL